MALHALWDLLVVPKLFFESRRVDDLTLPAIGAVVLTSLLNILLLSIVVWSSLGELPSGGREAFLLTFGLLLVFVPLIALVMWTVLAGIVYLLVRNRGPSATLARTFAVVGLAAIVELPAILAGSFEAYLVFETISFADPESAAQELQAASGGTSLLVTVVWVVVTLWQGYIWREGLRGAYDVTADRATLAAGVAVVISLLLVLWP